MNEQIKIIREALESELNQDDRTYINVRRSDIVGAVKVLAELEQPETITVINTSDKPVVLSNNEQPTVNEALIKEIEQFTSKWEHYPYAVKPELILVLDKCKTALSQVKPSCDHIAVISGKGVRCGKCEAFMEQQVKPSVWQPIESAPKDIVDILVLRDFGDWKKIEIENTRNEKHYKLNNITHWQPLPAAPELSTITE